jgi:hypothetical protein
MNTFTIEELDREEVEFLPPRVVMTAACNPCWNPCFVPCRPVVTVCLDVRVGCLIGVGAGVNA